MNSNDLEEGSEFILDFTKLHKVAACGEDVIPAVAQDVDSGDVLQIGYVNQTALETARREGVAVFWSTSRNELWIKGKTSGDYLEILDIRVNCAQNSILYRVRLREKAVATPRTRKVLADGAAITGALRQMVNLST